MELAGDGDHVMNDSGVIATTETNGTSLETLDPSQLALALADEAMSLSPEIPRIALPDGNQANGSWDIENEQVKSIIKSQTNTKPKYAPLPYATSRTGLVYDVRMRFHVEPIPKDQDMHPEDPRRIFEVYNELVQAGLVDDPTSPDLLGEYVLLRIPIRSATRNEILACHSERSFEFVMGLERKLHMLLPS